MLPLNTLIHENSLKIQQIKLIDGVKSHANKSGMSELVSKQTVNWILKFSQFHNKNHPSDLNQADIESFLSSLATENNYSEATQLKALAAIRFLYQTFLRLPLSSVKFIKNKARRSFADHFGEDACQSTINRMQGSSQLMAELAVFGRLKLKQVVNLKLSDIDIKKSRITVKNDNNEIKCVLNMPIKLVLNIRIQMLRARQLAQIKTQAYSNTYHIQAVSQSAVKAEYLFPVANTTSPHISSRSMQLALLKNDIKIAANNNLNRSSMKTPESLIRSGYRANRQLANGSASLFSRTNRRQCSFAFSTPVNDVGTIDRMRELKRSVA